MKKLVIFVLSVLSVGVYGMLFFGGNLVPSRAARSRSLDLDKADKESRIVLRGGASDIALTAPDGALYQTDQQGSAGVMEFLAQDPQAGDAQLLPPNFNSTSQMSRQVQTGGENHYFYQQTAGGMPVYGATFAVHQRQGNQIYALTGNLATSTDIVAGSLTEEQAKAIALGEAKKEAGTALLSVTASPKTVFNGKALGVSDDPANYETYAVVVESTDEEVVFGMRYFVATSTGEVLFSEGVTHEALNRQVSNCAGKKCVKGRNEGDPATGVQDVDLTYDTLGTYYNYFFNSYKRDSFDNKGAAYIARVDVKDRSCPNAWFDGRTISMCKGLVAPDVMSHEFTHAMNHAGPAFVYANQSGAIDESLADIFAYAIDGNWTMGETTSLGIIRSFDDPTKYGQPDRLFSPGYYCGKDDNGGVHKNGGILSKSFYLMVMGGTFNGCTVQGIGKEKALAVVYKASTAYMTASSNFKVAYTAFNQACSDLYGAASADCVQVKNALLAVEMDQQPEGSQKGPVCSKGKAKPVTCAAAPPPASSSSAAASSSSKASSSSSKAASSSAPATSSSSSASSSSAAAGSATLVFTIRFQGVSGLPAAQTLADVRVKLGGDAPGQTTEYKKIQFAAQTDGTWKGSATWTGIPLVGGYKIYFKGPMHLQKRICENVPKEASPGTYSCAKGGITIASGTNTIDASGITLLTGDLPDENGNQDGVANAYDVSLVLNNLNKTDPAIIKRADLNFDGGITAQDYSLIIAALSVRVEEGE